ncbi:MAG TPA: hypothetical protein RMH80_19805, partial [Polyangiaceae bacterium LLY-WYZ-15_(1-7)]|nr:hypothetical protein [Polyangiaceae bacterium LLY-WYZ-15_(1-7)]
WLRSRPTPVRRLVLALPIAGLALFGSLGAGSRAGALGLGLVGALLAAVSLRPIQLPAWPRAVRLALPFLALAFVAGFSAFGGAGPTELGAHLRCFAPGMGIAAAVLGLWWACAREPLGWAGLAGASAAGVAANAFLAGRCAMGGAQHLLLGHASVLLLVLVLTAAVLAFARR